MTVPWPQWVIATDACTQDRAVRRRLDDGDVVGRGHVVGLQHLTEGDDAVHGERRQRIDDALQQRGLVLVRRAEADEHQRIAAGRRARSVHGSAHAGSSRIGSGVGDVGGHGWRGEVEAWAGEHEDPLGVEDLVVERAQRRRGRVRCGPRSAAGDRGGTGR